MLRWMTAPSISSRCSNRINSIHLQASLLTARARAKAAAASGFPSICAARGPCSKQSRAKRSSVRSLPPSVERKPVVMQSFTCAPSRSSPAATRRARCGPSGCPARRKNSADPPQAGRPPPGSLCARSFQTRSRGSPQSCRHSSRHIGHMRLVRHCSASCRTVFAAVSAAMPRAASFCTAGAASGSALGTKSSSESCCIPTLNAWGPAEHRRSRRGCRGQPPYHAGDEILRPLQHYADALQLCHAEVLGAPRLQDADSTLRPMPGTRSSSSLPAVLTSTGKNSGWRTAQVHLGSR
mgnify:CR=1 FL=1